MNPAAWLRARKPTRIYYGWWIVAASSAMWFVVGGILFRGSAVFFVPVRDSLALSNVQTSLVFSLSRAVAGLGPVAGWLIERFGPRKLVVTGVLVATAGYVGFSRVDSFLWFALVYVGLVSLGSSFAFQHALWALTNMWFIRRRAFAMSFNALTPALGGAVLVPLMNAMIIDRGWEWAALVAAFMFLVVILPLTLVLRNSPESIGLLPDGDRPQESPETSPESRPANIELPSQAADPRDFGVGEALRTSSYWLLLFGIGLRWLVVTGMMVNLQPILIWKGVSQETVGYLMSLMLAVNVVATLGIGWIADRWPKSLILAFLPIGECVGLAVLLWSSWQGSPWGIFLFVTLLGVGECVVFTSWATVGDFFGRRRFASLRGIIFFANSGGMIASPVFMGWWADRTDGYGLPLWIGVVGLALASLFFAMMRRPRRHVAEGVSLAHPGQ